ncbi:hypothetical protein [Propylenella binzhouense]|uniref:VCBS repeat-containing protein n=1 Tax=Propylenella binzhouense TaxID=2555902 RepID=A0A964WU57_9HYPH|nr:hypothetical protein [Propylenella binzhouense]MYZ48694.1 hypothetical protein [Propylenella binzhouense]
MRLRCLLTLALIAALAGSAASDELPHVSVGRGILSASMRTHTLEVRLDAAPGEGDASGRSTPRVAIFERGALAARAEMAEAVADSVPAVATLVEMDPGNDTPEVVLEGFTGGAHCCNEMLVLSKAPGGAWQTIRVGLLNGAGSNLADSDGDGRYEIEGQDEAFLYRFGCYACSAAPLQILVVRNAELHDASLETRFQARHRAYLEAMEAGVALEEAGNGFLAGWVAEKAILGEGAEAWAEMLRAYNPQDRWGLEHCPDGTERCEASEKILESFPDALRTFLDERGYPL